MQEALAAAENLKLTANAIDRLAKEFGHEAAQWAFLQWSLRSKGHSKFTRAHSMFFTREGLEMSSHEEVARYHASLFPPDEEICDLTCGIGADLMAFAERGPALGIELNDEHACYAALNSGCQVLNGDGIELAKGKSYLYADPQRRIGDKRVGPNSYSPSVAHLRHIMEEAKVGLVKLSPMLSDEFLLNLGGDIEFISFGGECKEALVRWPGSGRISAVRVESRNRLERRELYAGTTEPQTFFYEADPAAIRAHALGQLKLLNLGDSNGYLTGSDLMLSEWLSAYKVLWHGSWRAKSIKKIFNQNGWKLIAVKKRGVTVEPQEVMKDFKNFSGLPVVMAIYQSETKIVATILQST